ncbi:MAG: acyl-ACP--UDP-N-acetylglucosamine O-acyltransferase, partial [Xanthomonadales bacterium]|nr:acyl-ACP--UDP-N-acetylglucosamine O-acyltransferase [Xanthomonadales bacterium]
MIHPTALVDRKAELDSSVRVGAYSVIGPGVQIAARTVIDAHVVLEGPSQFGEDNRIHSFACLGGAPQDKKYADEPTTLVVGDGNVIRESCTFNRGTAQDRGTTTIGDRNWIMAYVHIAHDCDLGNDAILANNATLAGHVQVGDFAILGGFTKVHQFCRIGAHSFSAMDSGLSRDLPPYVMAAGHLAEPRGLNTEGLKRRGFSRDALRSIREAYRTLYRSDLKLAEAIKALQAQVAASAVAKEAVA